ncbi:MAG TPA: hypothetical protein VKV39_00385 [Candidatus Sulfotelmatobacter sp.]|nr:hypothetical protein [Candidatus Sulfotelmatobacter sp.]
MKFLENLLRQSCSHRFGWPRVDGCGRHYQICLDCGTAYEYNWDDMRQTGRLHPLPAVAAAVNESVKHGWSWR